MRTDQFYGLNHRARTFLRLDENVKLSEKREMTRRYEGDPETDTGWLPVMGSRTVIEDHKILRGAFGNNFQLFKYELSDNFAEGDSTSKKFYEEIQCEPWSSGPMFFTALKDEKGEWVPESLWANTDPETEGMIYEEVTESYLGLG